MISDDLIQITQKLMLVHERREALNVAQELTALVEKIDRLESTGNEREKQAISMTLKFTKQEISKMSQTFKKEFIANGLAAHVIKRPSGKSGYYYEIRYRRNGYNITVSNKDLSTAKKMFINETTPENITKYQKSVNTEFVFTTEFQSFAIFYFTNFRKQKVTEKTYCNDLNRLKNHILPALGKMDIKKITSSDCKFLIDGIIAKGKGKTADEVYSLLSSIFKCAISHHLIPFSPLDPVAPVQYEQVNGMALTKDEEKRLLEYVSKTNYITAFAVALYTGMRPNEYRKSRIERGFIITVNSKRHSKKVEYKRIAISPMLAPYLEGVTEIYFPCARYMRDKIKEVLPNHKLYDLRTTFYSRMKECNIDPAARDEFFGHSSGKLGNAYTDLSDEYLLKEGQKLKY